MRVMAIRGGLLDGRILVRFVEVKANTAPTSRTMCPCRSVERLSSPGSLPMLLGKVGPGLLGDGRRGRPGSTANPDGE